MAFPQTELELKKAGYRFSCEGTCRECGAPIFWYQTPKKKFIPLNPDYQPHWATCPKAKDFRKSENGKA